MISGFRKSLRSWATIALLFLALVAIVVTGFGTGGGGGLGALGGGNASPTGDQLATVNGEAITADAASTEVNRSFQLLRRRLPNADMAEYLRQGGYEGAVDALINLIAMRQYGEARGLVATSQMIDRFLVNRPEFQNAVGQYDPAIYRQYLQQAGVNERVLRGDIARDLMRQQLLDPVAPQSEPGSPAILRVPQGVARAYAAARLERRRGAIGVVPVAALAAGINPSDAEIGRYYARNRAQYTVPERRVIKYAVIGAEQAAAPAPTEAEIQAVYRNTAHYQSGQVRTLLSVVFTGQSEANGFAQRVRGGTAFMEAARAAGRSEADVRLPNMRQAGFANRTSAEIAGQAFRAQQGAVIGPVRSPLGWHVVRVETISAGRPLETVRADIVRELERRKGATAVVALATRIEEQIDAGGSFEEVARAARLTIVTTPPITARGIQANGQAWAVPADLRPLLAATFEIDADNPEPAVAPIQENARYALIAVDRAEPAAVPPLAQVRDRVRTALIRERALARARQIANAIVARIKGGMPPARAFAEAMPGLRPPEAIDLRRLDIMRADRQAPAPLLAFFRIRPGAAEVLAMPNGAGWYVSSPSRACAATSRRRRRRWAQTQQELQETAGTELELQFLRAVDPARQRPAQRRGDPRRAPAPVGRRAAGAMRPAAAMILVVDNYDSFTWNLVRYLREIGAQVRVERNDSLSAAEALASGAEAILISPGPGAPDDAGISLALVAACAAARLPLLGICLGHQAIGQHFGGRVTRAPAPMHGKVSAIDHDGGGVFAGLPSPFDATRYHSASASRPPACPIAWRSAPARADGTIQGLRHATLPIHGVQFHPESVASAHGHVLLANFLAIAGAESEARRARLTPSVTFLTRSGNVPAGDLRMLTRKQHELLLYIDSKLAETGISPSFEEMKDALDLKSKSGVHRLISALGRARLHPPAAQSGARARSAEDARRQEGGDRRRGRRRAPRGRERRRHRYSAARPDRRRHADRGAAGHRHAARPRRLARPGRALCARSGRRFDGRGRDIGRRLRPHLPPGDGARRRDRGRPDRRRGSDAQDLPPRGPDDPPRSRQPPLRPAALSARAGADPGQAGGVAAEVLNSVLVDGPTPPFPSP